MVKPPAEPLPSLPALLKARAIKESILRDASPKHGAALPCSRVTAVMTVPAATASPGLQPLVLTTV